MGEREGYEVLRLIEHNQKCYISSDYVEGKSLIQWLKYHPNLTKKQLFLWIRNLADQLECIHKCRGNPCYQYVNPYSIILAEDGSGIRLRKVGIENRFGQVGSQDFLMKEYGLTVEHVYQIVKTNL